jgi:phage shock protein E
MFEGLFGRAGRGKSAEAHERVEQGATLLDVRTREEFAEGHLPGAVNVPVQELGTRLDELPEGEGYVVYCRSGGRSAVAASMLREKGHEVFDLGSINAW